jgi:hypothetical protein
MNRNESMLPSGCTRLMNASCAPAESAPKLDTKKTSAAESYRAATGRSNPLALAARVGGMNGFAGGAGFLVSGAPHPAKTNAAIRNRRTSTGQMGLEIGPNERNARMRVPSSFAGRNGFDSPFAV